VGGLITRFEVGRFCRTLGVLLSGGVAAQRALSLCGAAVGNRAIAAAVETAATRFGQGEGLSAPLARTGRFPALSLQLIRIGEETGRLEEMLAEVADIYDQEVQRQLDRLLAMLVPAITVGMGIVVALIVAAVMTAMISINDLARMAMRVAGKTLRIRNVPGPVGVRGRRSDNRLIFEQLGWAPCQRLELGMADTYRWVEGQMRAQARHVA